MFAKSLAHSGWLAKAWEVSDPEWHPIPQVLAPKTRTKPSQTALCKHYSVLTPTQAPPLLKLQLPWPAGQRQSHGAPMLTSNQPRVLQAQKGALRLVVSSHQPPPHPDPPWSPKGSPPAGAATSEPPLGP